MDKDSLTRLQRVIITGANGFLGYWLCSRLLDRGVEVYGVVRKDTLPSELMKKPGFHAIIADFSQYTELPEKISIGGFDCFFHFSWSGVAGQKKGDYRTQLENIASSCEAVEAAVKMNCKRFVFAGSVDEFEACHRPDEPFRIPTHSKLYGISKYSAEVFGKSIADKSGMEYVAVLPALTYGEGNINRILPNEIIRHSITGEDLMLIEGSQQFDLLYVNDTITGIIAAAERGKNMESYYIGHEKLKSFRELVEEINIITCSNAKLRFGTYQDHGCPMDYSCIDRTKLYRDTGFRCSVSLEEGISNTKKWLQKQEHF